MATLSDSARPWIGTPTTASASSAPRDVARGPRCREPGRRAAQVGHGRDPVAGEIRLSAGRAESGTRVAGEVRLSAGRAGSAGRGRRGGAARRAASAGCRCPTRRPRRRRAPDAVGPQRADRRREVLDGHDRQVEQRARGRAHRLGVERLHAAWAEHDGVGPRRVGGADDGAEVARVGRPGQDRHESQPAVGQRRRLGADDGEDALGVPAHRRQHLGGGEVDVGHGPVGRGEDLRVPLGGVLGEVEVAHPLRRVAHGLPHALRPLDEELAVAQTRRTPGQPLDHPHPIGSGIGQQVRAFGHEERQAAGALTSSGRLALATTTSCAKAAASFTASSASMRRSTSTPAALRPWMKRL